jgi:HEPN domain-containing protein
MAKLFMKKIDYSKDITAWLDFAEYDLKSAQWQLKGKLYTIACYASQQAAEKALKALLIATVQTFPKVHSLDRLLSEIKQANVSVKEINNAAIELDKYYITSRYPGQYGGPEGLYTKEDTKIAIQSAEKIIAFVYDTLDGIKAQEFEKKEKSEEEWHSHEEVESIL